MEKARSLGKMDWTPSEPVRDNAKKFGVSVDLTSVWQIEARLGSGSGACWSANPTADGPQTTDPQIYG
jgi:hypothetical protein